MLVKYNSTGSTYVTIGGARKYSIAINNSDVEITNSDDAGVQKLLAGAGVTGYTIKLEGVYIEDAASTAIRTDAATNAHRNYQFITPGAASKTYQGSFMITDLEESGEYNGAAMYSVTLKSAGAVTVS